MSISDSSLSKRRKDNGINLHVGHFEQKPNEKFCPTKIITRRIKKLEIKD